MVAVVFCGRESVRGRSGLLEAGRKRTVKRSDCGLGFRMNIVKMSGMRAVLHTGVMDCLTATMAHHPTDMNRLLRNPILQRFDGSSLPRIPFPFLYPGGTNRLHVRFRGTNGLLWTAALGLREVGPLLRTPRVHGGESVFFDLRLQNRTGSSLSFTACFLGGSASSFLHWTVAPSKCAAWAGVFSRPVHQSGIRIVLLTNPMRAYRQMVSRRASCGLADRSRAPTDLSRMAGSEQKAPLRWGAAPIQEQAGNYFFGAADLAGRLARTTGTPSSGG